MRRTNDRLRVRFAESNSESTPSPERSVAHASGKLVAFSSQRLNEQYHASSIVDYCTIKSIVTINVSYIGPYITLNTRQENVMYNNIDIYAPVLGKWALSCSNRLSDNRKQKFVKEYIEKAVSNSV